MFGLIVVALCFVYAARITLQLLRHRAIAREIGLPYMIFPVAEENILYQTIFETRLVPYLVNNWLSEDLADYINGSIYKCRWTVKDRLRTNYGGVYLTVTPGGLTCNISDAPVAHQVCGARHSFPKPVEKYGK